MRKAVGWLGELLITLGVFLLLIAVYDLWWTNVLADRESVAQATSLEQQWGSTGPAGTTRVSQPAPHSAFGLVYIPRLRDHVWRTPLIEGVDSEDLAKGLGHFPSSALPGEKGNFAVAGHRATNGEPLAYIDLLRAGDMVYVETKRAWFEYRLERDQIVAPDAVWVVDPVPGQPPGTKPSRSLITVVTCNPRWASYERWIWWGELVDKYPKSAGAPEEVRALGRT